MAKHVDPFLIPLARGKQLRGFRRQRLARSHIVENTQKIRVRLFFLAEGMGELHLDWQLLVERRAFKEQLLLGRAMIGVGTNLPGVAYQQKLDASEEFAVASDLPRSSVQAFQHAGAQTRRLVHDQVLHFFPHGSRISPGHAGRNLVGSAVSFFFFKDSNGEALNCDTTYIGGRLVCWGRNKCKLSWQHVHDALQDKRLARARLPDQAQAATCLDETFEHEHLLFRQFVVRLRFVTGGQVIHQGEFHRSPKSRIAFHLFHRLDESPLLGEIHRSPKSRTTIVV
mmetsp:Transcript_31568/g.42748  ORF Transcript_31568/g.42748 Transcript_31568/m.42748 type:complete len:283 (+) Transcript_31568:1668-2516(+)